MALAPFRQVAAPIAAGALLGLVLSLVAAPHGEPTGPAGEIRADFGDEVHDPTIMAGDADFVLAATVTDELRVDDDRTVFDVRVLQTLKGDVRRDRVRVSQLGFDTKDGSVELEGFPLLRVGASYTMNLAAPSQDDPADALVLMSSPSGTTLQELDPADPDATIAQARRAVRDQRPSSVSEDEAAARRSALGRWRRVND